MDVAGLIAIVRGATGHVDLGVEALNTHGDTLLLEKAPRLAPASPPPGQFALDKGLSNVFAID